jgi:hypothetical protein
MKYVIVFFIFTIMFIKNKCMKMQEINIIKKLSIDDDNMFKIKNKKNYRNSIISNDLEFNKYNLTSISTMPLSLSSHHITDKVDSDIKKLDKKLENLSKMIENYEKISSNKSAIIAEARNNKKMNNTLNSYKNIANINKTEHININVIIEKLDDEKFLKMQMNMTETKLSIRRDDKVIVN